jgi:protein SCO1/2
MRRLTSTIIALAMLLGGCTREPAREHAQSLRGAALAAPLPRPDFTLTGTDGAPFAFRQRTAGKLTLLMFGYTNCPDVCPVHAANIAAVVHKLSWEDRQKVMFVFVTTDPARDSLPAIRRWLDHFDSTFVGLRGTLAEVNAIQQSLNLPPAYAEEKAANGTYGVAHSAVVIAFEPNDSARMVYPFGIRQEDWAADIPLLLARTGK